MNNVKRGVIDLSSLIWTQLLGGTDKKFGRTVIGENGKPAKVNSAGYGYECAVDALLEFMDQIKLVPIDLIFVMEGKNSKADRQNIWPAYKAGRDKVPEQYEEFNKCKEMVLQTFLDLGSLVCWQDGGVEGDDVIGYLTQNLEGEIWVYSGDKDLAATVGGNVHHYRAGKYDENPFGDFPHRFISTYIALVGDSSDKIPGAKSFGEVAGHDLLTAYGADGLEQMEKLILSKQLLRLQEDIEELPADAKVMKRNLQKLIDEADNVYMSYELARLRVEKVNTLRRPLQWRVGMVKQRTDDTDVRLKKWAGVTKLVPAEHYDAALKWAAEQFKLSPFVSVDVEGSTPEESDEWLRLQEKEDKVDVLGSSLTSLQVTFGPNTQYTVYLPVDNVEEPGVTNLTIAQVRDFVGRIPREKISYVHNAAYELPVCYMAWGKDWEDDQEYHGFLRNVRDTSIGSSYVDENVSKGLKSLSSSKLGYEQISYDEVTTKDLNRAYWESLGCPGTLLGEYLEQIPHATGTYEKVMKGTGRYEVIDGVNSFGEPIQTKGPEIMVEEDGDEIFTYTDGEPMVKVQFKMNQLKASEVLNYGADDTICTAALANYFRVIMEIERTWGVYNEIETFPAYLTALAYVQGKTFSLEDMRKMEEEDDEAFAEAQPVLNDYLIKIGFEGTKCPKFEKLDPASIKEAFKIIFGHPFETKVRTLSKLAKLLDQLAATWDEDEELAPMANRLRIFAMAVADESLVQIQTMTEAHFKGDPDLDLNSPKQMQRLLYDYMRVPIRMINEPTELERQKIPGLSEAVKKFKKVRAGSKEYTLTEADYALLRKKAKSDEFAIRMAVAFDADDLADDAKKAIKAIGVMKKVLTRRQLFYKNWRGALHWKDNKIHSSANQCAAVTRRYSYSMPNEQQLPKKGEAVKFRGCYKPHKKNAVVCSIDYVGQELRLAAEVSQDKNMLACYIGDNLKDIHSITAAGAMKLKWGVVTVMELFDTYGADLARDEEGTYQLFLRLKDIGKADPIGKKADDLRKEAKNVNFGAQNGARAAKLSETLTMRFEDSQMFLGAREKMFPGVAVAADKAADEAKKTGYVTTLLGARRHLASAMLSDERGAADRASRQAWNFRIQGSAGEMTKLGMTRMWKTNLFFRYDAQFMMAVHDECVASVVDEHAVDFVREMHACMAQPYATMKVPVLGSISIGPDFANQTECGDWFIEERVKKALSDIFAKEEACV